MAKVKIWQIKQNALYLSVNVLCTKVVIGGTIFMSPTGDGTAILRGHLRPRESPAACSAKVVPLFVSHFTTLSIGLDPGI